MTQMTISPFINIIDKNAVNSLGLMDNIDYPVFAIDVADDDITLFLIANQKGEFVWVDSKVTRRANKKLSKYKPNI